MSDPAPDPRQPQNAPLRAAIQKFERESLDPGMSRIKAHVELSDTRQVIGGVSWERTSPTGGAWKVDATVLWAMQQHKGPAVRLGGVWTW